MDRIFSSLKIFARSRRSWICVTGTLTLSLLGLGLRFEPLHAQVGPPSPLEPMAIGDKQGQAILCVPLDFPVILLQQKGYQCEDPEIGEDDHDRPVAIRLSGCW